VRLGMVLIGLLLAQSAPQSWVTAPGGDNLVRPVFWESVTGVTADGGHVTVQGSDAGLVVDTYGPRIPSNSDFGIEATLQATTADLATLALVDGAAQTQPGSTARRVEVGLEQGAVVLGVFDGTSTDPTQWQTFSSDQPLGPINIGLYREADQLVLNVGGNEVSRISATNVFQSGTAMLGVRVASGNQLTLGSLDVKATPGSASGVSVTRCTPTRLLAGGSDASGQYTGLFWIWPDAGYVRQVDVSGNADDYLVAVSPDKRWVAYYQGPANYNPATDRFIVDTWVMDLQTDEQTKLVEGSSPIGWITDSSALVLGQHPDQMVLVPSAELVPTQGNFEYAQSMRVSSSPDQRLRAVVDATPQGAGGISILDAQSGDEVHRITTGRGAPQLAWSPDSTRLAYTSGNDSQDGLVWRLRLASTSDWSTSMPSGAESLALHSVIWAPPLAGC
jgi:hypothetical protein